MLWLVYALLAAASAAGRDLILKRYAKPDANPFAGAQRAVLGIALGCLGTLAWLAARGELAELTARLTPLAWLFILGALLETGGQLCYFAALPRLPVGTMATINASSPLFILIISWALYDDGALTAHGIAGTFLLVAAVLLAVTGLPGGRMSWSGAAARLAATVLFAGTNVILKVLTDQGGALAWLFWYPATAAVMIPLLALDPAARRDLRQRGLLTAQFLTAPLFFGFMLTICRAMTLAPGAWVFAVRQLSIFLTIAGGWYWLNERHSLRRQLLAGCLAGGGVILLVSAR